MKMEIVLKLFVKLKTITSMEEAVVTKVKRA